jgi:hypothetical protein
MGLFSAMKAAETLGFRDKSISKDRYGRGCLSTPLTPSLFPHLQDLLTYLFSDGFQS